MKLNISHAFSKISRMNYCFLLLRYRSFINRRNIYIKAIILSEQNGSCYLGDVSCHINIFQEVFINNTQTFRILNSQTEILFQPLLIFMVPRRKKKRTCLCWERTEDCTWRLYSFNGESLCTSIRVTKTKEKNSTIVSQESLEGVEFRVTRASFDLCDRTKRVGEGEPPTLAEEQGPPFIDSQNNYSQ